MFRNFKGLAQWIGENLRVENAVIDGEIACVDESGRSVFNDLLFRRRECLFFAFDLLFLNGENLRGLPLIERRARLKKLLRRKRSRVLYVDHVEVRGRSSSRRSANWTWRAPWRSGSSRSIDRRRSLPQNGWCSTTFHPAVLAERICLSYHAKRPISPGFTAKGWQISLFFRCYAF